MPARLIINADDFGLTSGINRAIAELHAAGAVTSATLMAAAPAFAHAVHLAGQFPTLGIGCHIVLTDGTPILPPDEIPSLLGPDRQSFRPVFNDFLRATLLGRLRPDEIRREAIAQIQTVQSAGISVTHLDTHKHTHILPQISRALLDAAEATGVRAIRNPFESRWSLRLGYTRGSRATAVAVTRLFQTRFLRLPPIRTGRVLTTNGTIGISATGQLEEPLLRQLLAALPDGTWEFVCHPGYNDPDLDCITTRLRQTREIERRALLAVFSEGTGQRAGDLATQHLGDHTNGRHFGNAATLPLQPALGESPHISAHPSRPELIHYGSLIA